MATGLGLLRLAPADFWGMTPRELGAAIRGLGGRQMAVHPPGRAAFARLMQRYPDAPRRAGSTI